MLKFLKVILNKINTWLKLIRTHEKIMTEQYAKDTE